MDRGDERQVWDGDNFVAKRILDELGAIRKAAVSNLGIVYTIIKELSH